MGVALYGLYIPLVLLILRNILFQLLQRTHDKRQRRLDIVCGVDEEAHLRFLQLRSLTSEVAAEEEITEAAYNNNV